MVTYVAIPYQAYRLSGSSLVVGLLGLAELAPLLVTAFVGGALADAFERRRMLQVVELAFATCSAVLLVNALVGEPRVWVLFVLAGVMAGLDGLQRPSLEALAPRLVDRDELMAEGALSSFRGTVGLVAGPLLAGLLIAAGGAAAAYGFDLATFTVSLACLALMRAVPPPPDAERPSLAGVVEGFRYAMSRPELVGTYGVDMIAMLFGMPEALFPALLGNVEGGLVAAVAGVRASIVSGGLLCIAGVAVAAVATLAFRRYDSRVPVAA